MNGKQFVMATMFVSVLLTVIFIPTSINSEPSTQATAPYDPWADINEDGKIDIKDLAYSAQRYGTLGDPAKNVTVTNWPTSKAVLVWYNLHMPASSQRASQHYNAYGFGQLHILMLAYNLSEPDTMTFRVYAPLWNQTHGEYYYIVVYSVVLTYTSYSASATIPVPGEEFYFYAVAPLSGSCDIFLDFYLTWS